MICDSRRKLRSYDFAHIGKRTVFSIERMVIAALCHLYFVSSKFFLTYTFVISLDNLFILPTVNVCRRHTCF